MKRTSFVAVLALLFAVSCDKESEPLPGPMETARAALQPTEGTSYDFDGPATACVDDVAYDSSFIGESTFYPFAWDSPTDLKRQIEHRGFEWADDIDLSWLQPSPVDRPGLKYAVLARLVVSQEDATSGAVDCERVFVGSEGCGEAIFDTGVRHHVVLFRYYETFDQIVQFAEVESFASPQSALTPLQQEGSVTAVALTGESFGDVETTLDGAATYVDGWNNLVTQAEAAANDPAVTELDGALVPTEFEAYDVSACSPSPTAACAAKFGPIAVEARRKARRLARATLPDERIWRYSDASAAGQWLDASETARQCANEVESAMSACELNCDECVLPTCVESLKGSSDLPSVDFRLDYLFEQPEMIRTARKQDVLAAASDQFCWLAGVQGAFAGAAEEVSMTLADNGRWVVRTRSQQEDHATGFATCVPWSAFSRYPGAKAPAIEFHSLTAGESMEFDRPGTVLALMGVGGGLQSPGDGFEIEQNPDGGGRAEAFGRTSITLAEVQITDGTPMDFTVYEVDGAFNEEAPSSGSSGDRVVCFPGRIRGEFSSSSEKMFVGPWPEVGKVAIGSGCDEGLISGCDNDEYRRISAAANCLELAPEEAQ